MPLINIILCYFRAEVIRDYKTGDSLCYAFIGGLKFMLFMEVHLNLKLCISYFRIIEISSVKVALFECYTSSNSPSILLTYNFCLLSRSNKICLFYIPLFFKKEYLLYHTEWVLVPRLRMYGLLFHVTHFKA